MNAILSQFSYGSGLLLCELIFLYAFPRRRYFPLRCFLAVILTLAWSSVVHYMTFANPLLVFFGMLAQILITYAGIVFSFAISLPQAVSVCVSGVALQHIGYHLYRMASLIPFFHVPAEGDPRMELGVLLLFALVFWLIIGRKMAHQEYMQEYDKVTGIAAVIIVFICIGISRFLRMGGVLNPYAVLCTSLYAITCCVLALFVQYSLRNLVRLKSEYLTYRRLAKTQLMQYETSRENAQMLNMKYHDLKHKLIGIEHSLPKEEWESMQTLLEEYDQTYHTGLEALDIILNEKVLLCRAKDISMTVMGNGALLGFMKTMDVYSLFGNIIENAVEAVEELNPKGRRQISIILEDHGDFVYVNSTNYMARRLMLGPDGLPQTSKEYQPGYHGFGLRSIQSIAKQYGGEMRLSADEELFSLSILLSPA